VEAWPGQPFPLGATFDGAGTNFSLFSEVAEGVELCIFVDGHEHRISVSEQTALIWHIYLPGIEPGMPYGWRVHGPWDPARGMRCNAAKLLLDPYAKAVEGHVEWDPAVFPYQLGGSETERNDDDSAPFVPKAIVTNPWFDWSNDHKPHRPLHETVVYEAHVKGLTMRHPAIAPDQRGTYAALAHPAIIEHLIGLGVTAVELQPIHQFVHAHFLAERGLRNYWGYDSIAYLAPHNEYSSAGHRGQQVSEFKAMVRTLHEAGLEVFLDVVYNHTAEGNHLGPMLSFKGIDNLAYYRVDATDPSHYVDYTGTGNSLNARHPHVLQLIMDSLRYWVVEMHVDGFRFDLAATLARGLHEIDRLSAFFDLIQQDPTISQVKLIAEPWDVGEGGYQVGNFPPLWSEWNGKYRDAVRDYWRGTDKTLAEFAYRLTGSSDLYETTGRKPFASINFVTCHDGFTLRDLVSYNEKHNEANLEGNRDGESNNRSWNSGVEGPTDDPAVNALRSRQQRNLLTTLFLSQGVPMLLSGDEIGRTQQGNNNAYCQDHDLTWLDWDSGDTALRDYVAYLAQLRAQHPTFRRRRFFEGRQIRGGSAEFDIAWFRPDGEQMDESDWDVGFARTIGVYLNGNAIASLGPRGERIVDETFFVIFNAHSAFVDFRLPPEPYAKRWRLVLDTWEKSPRDGRRYAAETRARARARSILVLRRED
jgi:isoamylase